MRIIHINTSSQGGAGIAALRLHWALHNNGVSSAYLSKDLTIDFNGNTITDSFFLYKKPSILKRLTYKLQSSILPKKSQKVEKEIRQKKGSMKYEILTTPFSSYRLNKHPLIVEADLINLHWVGLLLDYESFFAECKKPIVWTLHDMNPFLGLFHYSGDDTYNKKVIGVIDDRVKKIKADAINKVVNGSLVSPSKWLLDVVKKSGVFSHFKELKTIPNSIEIESRKVFDRQKLREQLGVDQNEFVLLFVAGNINNPRKGADLFVAALEILNIRATVIIVGNGTFKIIANPNLKIIPLGYVETQEEMIKYYSVVDALVLPSREDNLPNTMLESIACGTPVISFDIGGMKEYIKNDFNGCLVKEMNGKALAASIEEFFYKKNTYDRTEIIEFAKSCFNLKTQAEKYREVYLNLLEYEKSK